LDDLFQFDSNVTDSYQGDTLVSSSPDQEQANRQLSYTQGTINSIQNILPENPWSRSLIEIEDGNPSNSTLGYSEFARLSACNKKSDYYQEHNQQPNRYIKDFTSS
jgi:hypothetical protein